ncbi:MAG: MBL fold metallo-hydrolase, partial [Gemmatimonadota bacterium]|nr:MBL fold metallo-hydrolase [Gemmatimonadota bacterium]
ANRQVTGSCYLLEAGETRLLIDCGMYQERCCLERNWNPLPFQPETVDYVLLTHAHLDHCGLLPRLDSEGFRGKILCTPPSEDLAAIVLQDAARIQEEDVETKRRRHEKEGREGPHPPRPLFTTDDVKSMMPLVHSVDYEKTISLDERLDVRFHDSGHILGSAILEISIRHDQKKTTIVFSGDLGQYDSPLVHDPAKIPEADYVVMESTYGDRNHEGDEQVGENLAALVTDTVERRGNLIIPTFAIDRAQDLLYHLGRLAEDGRIPRVSVFLDSPMAIDVTSIYKRYMHLLDGETQALLKQGAHPFQFRGLHFVRNPTESRRLNTMEGPKVILAGSGMCTGGRIKHHLRHNLERSNSTVLFVGFQAKETLGREILDGAEKVRINGQFYPVKARIERLFGLSAHADRRDLIRWLGYFRTHPKRLFLTHGEATTAESLAAHVREGLKWDVSVPVYRETVELE